MNTARVKRTRVTLRSIIIGLALVAGICRVEAYSDYYVNNVWLAAHHFPIVAVFLMTMLVLLVNVFLKRTGIASPLSPGELVTIWCMMIVTASLPTLGLASYLLPTLVGLTYFATPENGWIELFHQYIPDWLIVKDRNAARYFYEELPFGESIPWGVWVKPVLFWCLFAFVLWAVMICMSSILRKQWVEREKFTFPLVELPVEIAQKPEGTSSINQFFRNKVMWIAFACPVIIHSISTLHFYSPVFPEIPLRFSTWHLFTEKPLDHIRPLDFNIFLSTIGLSYLMSLEISLSLWVFYLIFKLENVMGAATGTSTVLYYKGFVPRREMGAYVVLTVFLLWIARAHIRDVLTKAFSRKQGEIDDSYEPIPYRWSVLILASGLIALALLMLVAGAQTFWLMLAIMVFFAMVCIVDAWLVTRGLFFIHGSFKAPDFLVTALGTTRFGTENLTLTAFPKRVFFRDRREILMPHIVNSFKVSDPPVLNRRHLLIAICIALVIGTYISCYSYIDLAYHKGALTLGRSWIHISSPQEPFRELTWFLTRPQDTDWQGLAFALSGGVVMLVLIIMRYRFLWWPLHPIGFVTPGQFPMNNIWFSIFLGWLFKYVIVKYRGLKGYRRARPFFLGIVLGESFIAGVWAIIGLFTGKGYNFLYF